MTVKDVFELRRQGRIEEAYDAIRPMYAVHKGRYTTLCMFWTARDMFNLRLHEGQLEEADKIFRALKRVLPNIDDKDGRAKAFMEYAEQRLAQVERIKKNICVTDKPAAGEISAISALSAGQQTVLVKIKKITKQTQ